VFPRNQSQAINSRYAQVVKGFRRSEPFEAFVQGVILHSSFRYSLLVELADAFKTELLPRPFTGKTIADGVVPEFLRAIGIDPWHFPHMNIRRNEGAGPFTVNVARRLRRLITGPGKQLKWRQAEQCKKKLADYLIENGLADAGYCGLTTALAQHIETCAIRHLPSKLLGMTCNKGLAKSQEHILFVFIRVIRFKMQH
jgi:hypothetical protein